MRENNLLVGSKVTLLGAGGQDEAAGQRLCDGNRKTCVGWESVTGHCALLVELTGPADVNRVVCRWTAMPCDYRLEARVGETWRVLDSVASNMVLGPKLKLHLFSTVQTDRLRIRMSKPVILDRHGRDPEGPWAACLNGLEIYSTERLPSHVDAFLS